MSQLLSSQNVNQEALCRYAQAAADFATNGLHNFSFLQISLGGHCLRLACLSVVFIAACQFFAQVICICIAKRKGDDNCRKAAKFGFC